LRREIAVVFLDVVMESDQAGLKLVESFPGAMAIIATRKAGGGVDLTMSAPLRSRFRPATS
jgi:hypothetical protein